MNFHENLEAEFEFMTHNSIAVNRKITEDYFQDAGFKQSENFFVMKFKQGSAFKNGLVTNPLKWKSDFIITFSESNINLTYIIYTDNQIVSQTEIECWNRFIANYEKSLVQQKNLFYLNKEFVKKSRRATLKYIGYGLFITIISLFLFGVIADYYKLNPEYIFFPSGVITVLVLLLIQRKMNQDKVQ